MQEQQATAGAGEPEMLGRRYEPGNELRTRVLTKTLNHANNNEGIELTRILFT